MDINIVAMDDIDRYLDEDLGKEGDITTQALFSDEKTKAVIISKESCVLAGLEEAKEIFYRVGADAELLYNDGSQIVSGTDVVYISGPVKSILTAERLALNFLGRMSGIATETRKIVDQVKKINPNIRVAATRKTTPGFRKYEKKAVILGGGESHRFGLFDAVLIKDNHIACIGSIKKSIEDVKKTVKDKIIEVEIENESDAITASNMGVDVILIDNLIPEEASRIAKKIRSINPDIIIEISGGINFSNISSYAVFADRISLGCLTHSIINKDFSLEIIKK